MSAPKVRVVLIHGVGLPSPNLFGGLIDRLHDIGKAKEMDLVTISVDWHSQVESPRGEDWPHYNRRYVTELMRGLSGAVQRGHASPWPFRVLSLCLMLGPAILVLRLVGLIVSAACLIPAKVPHLISRQIPGILRRVPEIERSFTWMIPRQLLGHSRWVLFVYLGGCVLVLVLALAHSIVETDLLSSARSLIIAILRPLAFMTAVVLHPGVICVATLVSFAIGAAVTFPINPQLSVRPDLTYGIVPSAPLSINGQLLFAYLLTYAAAVLLLYLAYVVGRLILAPLKIMADVVCFMGDREYNSKLVSYLGSKIPVAAINGSDELILVGHSLGSVIAIEWLLGNRDRLDPSLRIRVVTLGSPLRRLVGRFFPSVFPSPQNASASLGARFRNFRWINIYRPLDPIGASLFDSRTAWAEDASTRQYLFGMRAHTDYWDDTVVFQIAVDFLTQADSLETPVEQTRLLPSELSEGSNWGAVDAEIEFWHAIGRRSWLVASILATGIALTTAGHIRSYWSGGGPTDPSQYRTELLKLGVPSTGWLYRFDRYEVLSSPDGRAPLPRPSQLCFARLDLKAAPT